MKAIKYTLFLLVMISFFCNANPPETVNVTFLYDNAGNRTERIITVNRIEKSDSIFERFVEDIQKDQMLSDEDITELIEDNTMVYPNPVENSLYIETDLAVHAKTDCYIFDINGRHIETIENIGTSHQLSLDNYPPGTYVLRISNKEHTLMFKIIKK